MNPAKRPPITPINIKRTGIGRLIIPSDISRDEFISRCYSTGTVAMFTNGNGVLTEVAYCIHCEGDLKFPESYDGYGSAVTYKQVSEDGRYVVDGVLKSPELAATTGEYQSAMGQMTSKGTAFILTDPAEGSVTISVSNPNNGGVVSISAGSMKQAGKVLMSVMGEIGLTSDDMLLSVRKGLVTKLAGEVVSELNKDGLTISHKGKIITKAKKYSVSNSDGYSLKDLLDDIITEVSNSMTATSLGSQPLINKATILALKNKVKNILE